MVTSSNNRVEGH